ncbi:interferon-induced very large GTPase 1 [Epinephelus fuscoguttatus]|uniref:interferon-induced very large GTPase 1 n=1 Tax=Epinephelus fuscoguttatus TaxID=293821 RepID=UPI0020D08C7C|nr:interferon-induced very large GTPase 1 [Epinephelus fuscoguttatus]XP_049433198.1 interferon-induced very large GTPase 1 [Epinephelus fuscoguttatus]XP_049433199.1 interferon-induced very large GTPase 1 [Epinephelus fuscoguttatus]
MSVKLSKRLSSKKKKPEPPKDNAQTEVLHKLGLDAFRTVPLDPASMLGISTWTLENQAPLEPNDLPLAFLQRLWLLSPDTRSPCCQPLDDALNNSTHSPEETISGFGEDSHSAINPLDLVTAVFMFANTFLQQEMAVRMLQCQFAVPLVLPNMDPEESSRFLLWPLRGAVSQWRSHFPDNDKKIHEGDLASTYMPVVSCVKLGHIGVSKSQVLNNVISGLRSSSDTFLHRGMDGGQLPHRLSNGLVEIGWYLPTGDTASDVFPVPMVISNLRGDASAHEKYLSLLCQASSAVVVFCGNLREKDKQLLAYCNDMANKLILIDLSDNENNENRVVGFVDQNLQEYMGLPGQIVLQGQDLSEEELANRLRDTLKDLLPNELQPVTLEAAAKLAEKLGFNVDEGPVCKRAMATVEEVLRGLDEGSAQFKEKQLPLQGLLWSKLAEVEKKESRQEKEGKKRDPQLKKEKKDILAELRSYKMTPAMKTFTNALSTTDKVERAYFLTWMKLMLRLKQTDKTNSPQDLFTNLQTEMKNNMSEHCHELQNGVSHTLRDSHSSTFEKKTAEKQDVSEQHSEKGQESEHILQVSTENGASNTLGDSDSFCTDSIFEEDTTEEEELSEQHFEGRRGQDLDHTLQESAPVFEDQNHHLEFEEDETSSCQSKQLDEPVLTPAKSDLTSSAHKQICLDVNEPVLTPAKTDLTSSAHKQICLDVDERALTPVESDLTSPAQQQMCLDVDERALTPVESDLTSSAQQQICLDVDEPVLTPAKSDLTSCAQQMCLDVSFEHPEVSCSKPFEPDSSSLGLEHFLREMGLIFELTHISPGSGNHNVLRLPGLATDLLLHGIPLELMDGDASNIPMCWLGCVFAELNRCLPQEQRRIRVLTNLGEHHSRNSELFSALFGVKFPEGRKRATRGVYMVPLSLPDNLRKDMACDFLLLIDVEGLCAVSQDNKRNMLIHDSAMATVATGLSDVLMLNISSHTGAEFETHLAVIASALLRIKECGSMPICQLVAQDEGINSLLQAAQLQRVSDMLQDKTRDRGTNNADNHYAKATTCIPCVKGPWNNMSLSEPVDNQYSKALLKLKQNLFGALKQCPANSKATCLPEFMSRLSAVWDAVKAESFSIGLQNTDIASAFSLLCTELSHWEHRFLEHTESWFKEAAKKISATKAKTSDATNQNGVLSELRNEARKEVKTEVDTLRSKVETYLTKYNLLKRNTFSPILMSYMDDLQERVTEEIIQRLGTFSESHCYSTQLEKFDTLMKKEQESQLRALIENSKLTKVFVQDTELEEVFESMWSKLLLNFDFRPSEKDDITPRVIRILMKNLMSRGLKKHMKKLNVIGQNQRSSFQVYDEHFGYRSRLKGMFEDNNRLQMVEAQRLACNIIQEYHQFVEDKCSLPADFSDSYITELLENVETALKQKPVDIRSAYEADLKVYLCDAACEDFQKLHDSFVKDSQLLACITAKKNTYEAEFFYQFRKRDQCQRMAQAFTSMVIKPTVLDYIYRPLGLRIVEEIQGKAQQYRSPQAFHQSLLEDLIKEDRFEGFLEYLLSYDIFRMKKVQEKVMAHLSESTSLEEWKQQRLGQIVGKVAAAVSQTAEGTNGVLSDTKPLLERVCLNLEKDGDVDVPRAFLDGPVFSITTEWDRFVTCEMEVLAAMRLDLAQEFTQKVEITQFLQCLPTQPQDSIFNRVRGCDQRCPLCRAPCDLAEIGHEVHQAMFHRPKGILCYDPVSLSCIGCPESTTQDQSEDTYNMSVACSSLHSLYPDWSISPEDPNSQLANTYWRYVLARFNEMFANTYDQEPGEIPEEWKKITAEDALCSLKEAFLTGQC